MKRILVIFNTCDIKNRGVNHAKMWVDNLKSLQECVTIQGVDFIISDCMSSEESRNYMIRNLENVKFIFTNRLVPLQISFNNALLKSIEKLGAYSSYLYLDSGVYAKEKDNYFEKMYDILIETDDLASLHILTDTDTGLETTQKLTVLNKLKEENYLEKYTSIKIGEFVNIHCQLFTEELRQAFRGRLLPDMISGPGGMESMFTYMSASINKRTACLLDNYVKRLGHLVSFDIPSQISPIPVQQKIFSSDRSLSDILKKGKSLGFGFNEVQGGRDYITTYLDHDESLYVDELPKDENVRYYLHKFLKENLFLTKEEFDYDKLETTLVNF